MSKSAQNQVKTATQQQQQQNDTIATNIDNQINSVQGTAASTAASILPGVTSGYSDIAATGGYDPSVLGNIQSTYNNLATTGGITSDQIASMQDTASQAARSTYQTGAAEAEREQAATGGYGVSGSILGSLARNGSEAGAQASESVEGSIAGLQQQGQIAGAAGLVNEQNSLNQTQQNLASNKLTATSGLANIYGMNEQQVTATVSQILQNYQQTGQLDNQDLSILTNLANQPGVFSQIVSTIGSLGGAAAGIMNAVGSSGGSSTPGGGGTVWGSTTGGGTIWDEGDDDA